MFEFVEKASAKIKQKYPLLEFFDFGDNQVLVYDAKAHFSFVLGKERFMQLLGFLNGKKASAAGDAAALYGRFGRLRDEGVFWEGPVEEVVSASDERIAARVEYFAENILFRKFCLEVTQDCNLRCKYCPYTIAKDGRKHKKRHMTFDVARKAIDLYFKRYVSVAGKVPAELRHKLYDSAAPTLLWYGGESFLNFPLIKKTKEYFGSLPWGKYGVDISRARYSINTNMTLFNDEMMRFLVDNNVVTQISLDGPRDMHDKNRVFENGAGSFDAAFKNILCLKKYSPAHFRKNVFIISVETDPLDAKRRKEFFEKEDLVPAHRFCMPADYRGDFIPTSRVPGGNTVKEAAAEFSKKTRALAAADFPAFFEANEDKIQTIKRSIWHVSHNNPKGVNRLDLSITCPMGFDHLMVDYQGKMHMCNKTDGSIPVGHIDSGWENGRISAYYKALHIAANKKCSSCWAVRFCKICAANKVLKGKFKMPRKEECGVIRDRTRRAFYMDISLRKNGALMKYIHEQYKGSITDGFVDIQNIIGAAK